MEKVINKRTLPIVVFLGVIILLGLIGIGKNDLSSFNSDANTITFKGKNISPSGQGVIMQSSPFINVVGTPQAGLNNTTANPPNNVTVPSEGVWMGMEIEGLSPGTIAELKLPKNQKGVILDSVPPGSDAEKAGLKNGDIVRAINGQIIVNMADYIRATKNQKLTSGVIEIERNGQLLTVTIPAKQVVSQTPSGFQQQPIQQQQSYLPYSEQSIQQQQAYSPFNGFQQQPIQQPIQQQQAYSPFKGFQQQPIQQQQQSYSPYSQQPYSSQWNQYSPQSGVQAGLPAPNIDALTSASAKFTRIVNPTQVPPITMLSPLPHPYVGVCTRCHEVVQGRIPLNLLNTPMTPQGVTQGNSSLPTPAEQNAAHKVLVEGHWLGMELIPITPSLARTYNLPAGVQGLLVDEVTLESAESGLLAGDVLQSINGIPTPNLEEFELATREVSSLPVATLGALRKGQMVTLTLRSSWSRLGVAQNEAAQPIQPGALRPHKDYGKACTDCHIIMTNGGQLLVDAGDILPAPAPITANSVAPHSFRGHCNRCHIIIK